MTYNMKLQNDPFNKIKNGTKTIEMRLYDEKRQLLKINDTIIFTNINSEETIKTKIINLYQFPSFKELYKCFDKKVLGYNKNEKFDSSDMNKYYSLEEQNKYGVLAIEIELIK